MSSRCRQYVTSNKYVPVYVPKCCVEPVNNDPNRNNYYIKPAPSRSEPLSHHEYLRKKKENNGQAISAPENLVQVGQGVYKRTLWTAVNGSCCNRNDLVLPAVPAVHQGEHALDSGLLTAMRGANAARGTVSKFDLVNRTAETTTLKRQGLAIAADNSFNAPAGSVRSLCNNCQLSGTTINPGTACNGCQ